MSVDSLGITVDRRDTITFWASRSEEWACLVIDAEGTHCEIKLDRVAVEALRDHLPTELPGLDRCAAEDAGCERAGIAGQRALDSTAQALELAAAADAAGAHDLAASLRAAASEATATANAADSTVRAFRSATAEADHAAEKLTYLIGNAGVALRRLCQDDRCTELAER
jgi:hypothetical protein